MNSVDNTELLRCTPSPTQHHSFFRNLPLYYDNDPEEVECRIVFIDQSAQFPLVDLSSDDWAQINFDDLRGEISRTVGEKDDLVKINHSVFNHHQSVPSCSYWTPERRIFNSPNLFDSHSCPVIKNTVWLFALTLFAQSFLLLHMILLSSLWRESCPTCWRTCISWLMSQFYNNIRHNLAVTLI